MKSFTIIFKKAQEYPIIIILTFASILRFWGIWHGYPFSYYPDEQHFVNRAVSFGSGDLNPHWFHKPAFLMYLLFFEYGIFFVIGRITGVFPNTDAFAIYYFQDTWPFILIGRITVTLFGIATIYLVYKIGERFWSKKVGLYGSILLTLSYAHIFRGQDVKADVPATFFTILSAYYLIKLVTPTILSPMGGEDQSEGSFNTKDYILTGLLAGLGTATKYYSIVLLPCIFMVSIYEVINKKNILLLKKYIYSLIAFWGSYFIASPYNFLDPLGRRATFGGILDLYNRISPFKLNLFEPLKGSGITEYKGHYIFNSFIDYLNVLLSTEGAGMIIGIIFILSICYILYRPKLSNIILLSFPILFAIISIIVDPSYSESRHQLIIYPFLSIASGIMMYELFKRYNITINIILPVLLIIPLTSVIKNSIYISRPDTRTVAKEWIESNIPSGTKLILDSYSPVLKMNKKRLKYYHERSKHIGPGQFTTHIERYYRYQILASSGITYYIKQIRHIWWRNREIAEGETEANTEFDRDMANPVKEVGINSYDFYKEKGYKYVITSNQAYNSYLRQNSNRAKNFPSYTMFYKNLFSKGKVIKEFNPADLSLPGPLIKIIKIR